MNELRLQGVLPSATYWCERCEMLWRSPRPSPEDLAAFYSTNSFRYPDDIQRAMAEDQARWLIAQLKVGDRGGRFIEYGAGGGWLVDQMQRSGIVNEALGFEPDAHAISAARARGVALHHGLLEYAEGARDNGPAPDIVALMHVFEHLIDPQGTLALLAHRHGSHVLFIEVPDARFEGVAISATRQRPTALDQHLWSFGEKGLTALLEASAYTIERCERVGSPGFWGHYTRGQHVLNLKAALQAHRMRRGTLHWQSASLALRVAGVMIGRVVAWPLSLRFGRPDLPSLRILARYKGARA